MRREEKIIRQTTCNLVLLDGWVAIEEQGHFALLKGFTLDRFIGFAGDRVA